jgi:hypothetical protein
VPQSGWVEYLEALERYLRSVSEAVARGQGAPLPTFTAARGRGALPDTEVERAVSLLDEIERVTGLASARRDAVLASTRALNDRRRVVARPSSRRFELTL